MKLIKALAFVSALVLPISFFLPFRERTVDNCVCPQAGHRSEVTSIYQELRHTLEYPRDIGHDIKIILMTTVPFAWPVLFLVIGLLFRAPKARWSLALTAVFLGLLSLARYIIPFVEPIRHLSAKSWIIDNAFMWLLGTSYYFMSPIPKYGMYLAVATEFVSVCYWIIILGKWRLSPTV